jgi:hypothetical protein
MTRRLFTVAAGVSLLLCAAAVAGLAVQPGHAFCFSTGLPAGRLLIVSAQDRVRVSLWRDWPVWEWPAVHSHVRRRDFDYCGPLVSPSAYHGQHLYLGVTREDLAVTYYRNDQQMPAWPERRPLPPGLFVDSGPAPIPTSTTVRRLVVPYWLAIVCTAALPLLRLGVGAVAFRRRWQRRHAGLCEACGYDLRATPGRCPECGVAGDAA